jgi:hypothetical protein
VPIKAFIHEALRRSRTSGTVLQTALCYLEAIRPKVLKLVEKEKIGDGVHDEPDLTEESPNNIYLLATVDEALEFGLQVSASWMSGTESS